MKNYVVICWFSIVLQGWCSEPVWLPTDIRNDQVQYWNGTIETNNINGLLRDVEKRRHSSWPSVVSAEYSGPRWEEIVVLHKQFRELGRELLGQLEALHKKLSDKPYSEVQLTLDALLALRDEIASRPSYINYVLVDVLNGIVSVQLARCIAERNSDLAGIEGQLEKLQSFRLDFWRMASVLNAEEGRVIIRREELDGESDAEAFKILWEATVGPVNPNWPYFPEKILNATPSSLLAKRDFGLLLFRWLIRDAYIRTSLPVFLEYRRKAKDFAITNSRQEIEKVVGDEEIPARSLSQLLEVGRVTKSTVVSSFLTDIRGGTLDTTLFFQLPDNLKERGKSLERKD